MEERQTGLFNEQLIKDTTPPVSEMLEELFWFLKDELTYTDEAILNGFQKAYKSLND